MATPNDTPVNPHNTIKAAMARMDHCANVAALLQWIAATRGQLEQIDDHVDGRPELRQALEETCGYTGAFQWDEHVGAAVGALLGDVQIELLEAAAQLEQLLPALESAVEST